MANDRKSTETAGCIEKRFATGEVRICGYPENELPDLGDTEYEMESCFVAARKRSRGPHD